MNALDFEQRKQRGPGAGSWRSTDQAQLTEATGRREDLLHTVAKGPRHHGREDFLPAEEREQQTVLGHHIPP